VRLHGAGHLARLPTGGARLPEGEEGLPIEAPLQRAVGRPASGAHGVEEGTVN
jgi:hypothetical protein